MSIEGRKDNRSFNIPNGKTAFGDTIPVRGNGKTLGLTDGISNGSLYSTSAPAFRPDGNVSVAAGTSAAGTNPFLAGKNIGVSTDASKSGIVADISGGVTVIIKY